MPETTHKNADLLFPAILYVAQEHDGNEAMLIPETDPNLHVQPGEVRVVGEYHLVRTVRFTSRTVVEST